MVVCKYYRQGNCRYGQYCQFEHINVFVNGNNEDEITAVAVAREVLTAERGGQWLLSCFAPFKERPCIPGMEDLSPEEVRWEMYQAQQNGLVEQAKLRFQQLCQDMKTKRDALKNPTHETIDMLKKIVGNSQKSGIGGNATAKPSKFSFATSQLNVPNSNSTSNVFGNKLFVSQNMFGGNFGLQGPCKLLFTRTNNLTSLFGGNPTFNNNIGFPNVTSSGSVFGNTTNTSAFGSGQNNQTFHTTILQTNSIFGGGSSQTVFGQSNNFAATTQTANVFARSNTSQATTSVFDSGPIASNSLFYAPQSNASLFGENKPSTNGPFGESPVIQTSNSIFGTTTSSGNLSSNATNVFGQPKTTPAFGGAPIFGASGAFSNNSAPSMFGGQAFKDSQVPGDVFGRFTTPSNFGAVSQATNVFNATTTTSTLGVFGIPQNTLSIMTTSNSTPFVSAAPTTSISLGTVNSQNDSKDIYTTARPTFGITNINSPLNTLVTSSTIPFGPVTGTSFNGTKDTSSPFVTSTFGSFTPSVMQTNTTITTTTTNPFVSQQTNPLFNSTIQKQNAAVNESFISNQSNEKSLLTFPLKDSTIDHSVYSKEVHLTDDEKNMFLADKFIIGKIPLKPPCESMR